MRKAAFWVAVGATSVLANFTMELLADRLPSGSLRSFVSYLHRGPGGA